MSKKTTETVPTTSQGRINLLSESFPYWRPVILFRCP